MYQSTRPLMTRDELAARHNRQESRNYILSDDGFDDMELAARRGWTVESAWGRDGWDLGNWPYVSMQMRENEGSFLLQTIVEGDHDLYTFDSEADRTAAIDYLFLWYAADKEWAPLTYTDRETLDIGGLIVPEKFRGPFSWARLDAEKAEEVDW